MASNYVVVRVRRATHRALLAKIRNDPGFKGPPKWTITDVVDFIVSSYINEGGKNGRK